jgi:hypothetical protein
MELLMGIEPMASSLPRKCSTTELQQRTSSPLRAATCSERSGEVAILLAILLAILFAIAFARASRTSPWRLHWMRTGLERAMGIEPTLSAWKAEVLPLNYARTLRLEASSPPPSRRRRVSTRQPGKASRERQAGEKQTGGETGRGKEWWGEADSNRRRCYHQIYSLAHLAALEPPRGSSAVPAPLHVQRVHVQRGPSAGSEPNAIWQLERNHAGARRSRAR